LHPFNKEKYRGDRTAGKQKHGEKEPIMRKRIIIGCILCYMGLLKIPLSLAELAMARGGDTVCANSKKQGNAG